MAPETPKNPEREGDRQEGTQVLERPKTKKPKLYRVILHNDHYTTQEFVVHVLLTYFRKSPTEALHVMLKAHTAGRSLVGVYTKDVAESRVTRAMDDARRQGHPLLMTTEPDD